MERVLYQAVSYFPHWVRPNHVTALRIFAIPVVCLMYATGMEAAEWTYVWLWGAVLVWVFSGLTDWFDGALARSRGLTSAFGKAFDELADKAAVWTMLALLWFFGEISIDPLPMYYTLTEGYILDDTPCLFFVGWTIVLRDVVMIVVRRCSRAASVLAVSRLAKHKTVIQFVAITLLLAGSRHGGPFEQTSYLLGGVLLSISAILAVKTAISYLASLSWSRD